MIFTPIENKPLNLPTKVVIAFHICELIDLQVALLEPMSDLGKRFPAPFSLCLPTKVDF